jgi:hypothetical protein
MQKKLFWIVSVGFDTTDQISCIRQREFNETVHQLFIDVKKAYDSVRREARVRRQRLPMFQGKELKTVFGPKSKSQTMLRIIQN